MTDAPVKTGHQKWKTTSSKGRGGTRGSISTPPPRPSTRCLVALLAVFAANRSSRRGGSPVLSMLFSQGHTRVGKYLLLRRMRIFPVWRVGGKDHMHARPVRMRVSSRGTVCFSSFFCPVRVRLCYRGLIPCPLDSHLYPGAIAEGVELRSSSWPTASIFPRRCIL